MNQITKVLEVCARLNVGGAQLVGARISEYAPSEIKLDYLVFGDEIGEYEAAICARGHRVIHFPRITGNGTAFLRELRKLMRRERYDVVHCHTMYSCGLVMLAAKLEGIPGRLSHSHTTQTETRLTIRRRVYIWAMKRLIHLCGNGFLACGVDAGNTLYGKRWFAKHGTVIPNGIDTALFQYSEDARAAIREEYGWKDSFIVGHVGHYINVKNQRYLIRLVPKLKRRLPNVKLVLFGDGSDRSSLEGEIRFARLEDTVFLMGNSSEIPKVLSGFDVFAFPSLYEGTPLALIEAQANGLPCVISDRIPPDACILDTVQRLPIENAEAQWMDAICRARRERPEEKAEIVRERYGGVQSSMEQLYQIFGQYCREEMK